MKRVIAYVDGYKMYLEAVGQAFGADVDYAMLVKLYGIETEQERSGIVQHSV